MPWYLGIDTSNYTTSTALYQPETNELIQQKKLLPVKAGNAGLRQSDAVFHHTKQLPLMVEALPHVMALAGIGVSVRPRNQEGSYMPCFLCGEGAARMLAAVQQTKLFPTSHQVGHILAALFSAGALSCLHTPFLAFHVSGGTTDCVYCQPDAESLLRILPISTSLDLHAGQVVDRVGLQLGLQFPCGPALEQLAMQSSRRFSVHPTLKGKDCCLSGVENQCASMLAKGETPADIAAYCLQFISETLLEMTTRALAEAGDIPLVYAGGVMSNRLIRAQITANYPNAAFAEPAFSCDNAAGVAIYAALQAQKNQEKMEQE